MIKSYQIGFVLLIAFLSPFNASAGGWGAAISGGLRGYAEGRSEEIRRQQEFEYQMQLMQQQQEIEYQRQLMHQQQYIRQQEEAKNAEEYKRAGQSAAEKKAAESQERQIQEAEVKELNEISMLASKAADKKHAIAESKLNKFFPEWKSIVSSANFFDWYSKQPPYVQALADSENPDDAIKLLNQFQGKR